MEEESIVKKVVTGTIVVVSLVIAVLFYAWFDFEGILWNGNETEALSQEQIDSNRGTIHIGKKAGDGIPRIKSMEEWEDVLNDVDYVTVTPISVKKTDVYSLAKWADHYTKPTKTTRSRRRAEVQKTWLDISANYTPYYIIGLEDGTAILCQMNRGIAKKIENGESVELPLGRKTGLLKKAKEMLEPICDELNVSTDYVLYTIDDNWEKDNADMIFFVKVGVSVVFFFVIAVGAQLAVDKFVFDKKKDEV